MIASLSHTITNSIVEKVGGINKEKAEIIDYGIYVFISEAYKTVIFIIISLILGITVPVFVALFVFGLYRFCAGGIHSKSQTICLLVSLVIMLSTVYAAYVIPIGNIFFYTMVYVINVLIATLYAPSDTESKPIVSKRQRKQLKFLAIIVLTAFYIISISFHNYYSNIISIASLMESIMVLPIMYRLTKTNYGGVLYGNVNN